MAAVWCGGTIRAARTSKAPLHMNTSQRCKRRGFDSLRYISRPQPVILEAWKRRNEIHHIT
jgi:hypothetical protein